MAQGLSITSTLKFELVSAHECPLSQGLNWPTNCQTKKINIPISMIHIKYTKLPNSREWRANVVRFRPFFPWFDPSVVEPPGSKFQGMCSWKRWQNECTTTQCFFVFSTWCLRNNVGRHLCGHSPDWVAGFKPISLPQGHTRRQDIMTEPLNPKCTSK